MVDKNSKKMNNKESKELLNPTATEYLHRKKESYAKKSQQEAEEKGNEFWLHLNHGESAVGPTPKALEKLEEITSSDILGYPEEHLGSLKESISEFYGVGKENIILGTGSDCIIETIPRIFVNGDERSLMTVPEFFRFEDAHQRAGTTLEFVERDEEENYEFTPRLEERLVEKIREIKPKITWISTPNNPTGQVASLEFIRNIHRETSANGGILVVDEAYGEFNDGAPGPYTTVDLIKEGAEKLIVLRTFSKGYALAGLRVGYGIASDDLIESGILREWPLPYDVSNVSALIAPLALEDQEHMEKVRELTKKRRELIEDAIESNPNLSYIDGSVTNTLLVKYAEPTLGNLNQDLEKLGVRVSSQDPYEGTKDKGYARITVGDDQQVKDICDVLKGLNGDDSK